MAAPKNKALTLGFVGFGNMGRALALGVLARPELKSAFPLLVYERYEPSAAAAREQGLALAKDAAELAKKADIILLAVKPDQAATALAALTPSLSAKKMLVSIAAGISLDFLHRHSKGRCALARVMPNTPVLAGHGIFGLCFAPGVAAPMQNALRTLLSGLGLLIEIDESKMNAFTGLSGSGPGYVFHFMESLAEAGVSVGLDRQSSQAIAAGLLRGCAAMAEQSGLHPAVLREQVSSPAGTTIAGLNHLDRQGARGALIDAVRAATRRGEELEKDA